MCGIVALKSCLYSPLYSKRFAFDEEDLCVTVRVLHVISHEQTQSAIFISLFWFGCSRSIDFFSEFYNNQVTGPKVRVPFRLSPHYSLCGSGFSCP